MARKIIIDCDPGIDDAVALTMALFDPRLEVVAVTAVAGNAPAEAIAFEVGYEDAAFFRRLFRRHVRLTPSQYRKRFGGLRRALGGRPA